MTSIRKPEVDVQAIHSTDQPNAICQPTVATTGAESLPPTANEVSTTSPRSEERHLLAKELKEEISFRSLLEADRHQFKTSGSYHMCRCPFHPDRTPSFSIYEDDNYARCFGCDWHGDILTYEMDFHRCDFFTAVDRLNDFYYHYPRAGRKAKAERKKEKVDEPALTEKQIAERKKHVDRLDTEGWLAAEICRKRFEHSGEQWKPQTLQQLAKEGSLGWSGDCLAFIYPWGTKYRHWPFKGFEWDGVMGLWRQHRLAEAQHVYLTESETDAIALLDAGLENTEGVAVIAVPGASCFKEQWAPLFLGKKITLCFDNDEAGKKGADKTGVLLEPYAAELFTFAMGEVSK